MSKILDYAGLGTSISGAQNDSNLSSLAGINESQTGTTYTVTIDDQNRTIELSNASPIAVTLTAIATIVAALHTDDFKVILKNIGAGLVTITCGGTDTFEDGSTSLILSQYESIPIQTDSTLTKWNVINSEKPSFYGATVITTTASTAVTVGTDILWESSSIDTDSITDIGGANPERLTIPAWANYAKLSFALPSAGTPSWCIYKNGAVFVGRSYSDSTGLATYDGVSTAWLSVTSGDYFTIRLITGTGVSIAADAWLSIELKK